MRAEEIAQGTGEGQQFLEKVGEIDAVEIVKNIDLKIDLTFENQAHLEKTLVIAKKDKATNTRIMGTDRDLSHQERLAEESFKQEEPEQIDIRQRNFAESAAQTDPIAFSAAAGDELLRGEPPRAKKEIFVRKVFKKLYEDSATVQAKKQRLQEDVQAQELDVWTGVLHDVRLLDSQQNI